MPRTISPDPLEVQRKILAIREAVDRLLKQSSERIVESERLIKRNEAWMHRMVRGSYLASPAISSRLRT
jgi:hypothetical protein